jgi:hypothetical protein
MASRPKIKWDSIDSAEPLRCILAQLIILERLSSRSKE